MLLVYTCYMTEYVQATTGEYPSDILLFSKPPVLQKNI